MLGVKKYLELYRTYSRTEEKINNIKIDERTLPPKGKWQTFIDAYTQHPEISLNVQTENTEQIFRSAAANIFENDTRYIFRMKDTLCFVPNDPERTYVSNRFSELTRGKPYHGEKYMIIANEQEINVVNLYTNNVIANIVGPFSVPPTEIPKNDGWFEFSLKKNLFEENLEGLLIY